ncbi:hypothetical protein KI387_020640 [Taxus chinensis]|uniref:Fe2OG dioxygenase domain-containing protein n=1 Tax=Taxus chinensis TaxID=29808 RepID=A0AA38G925_TAXCH|nr:hypothetical protein KI387_020640 [Taxus chinensis]
MGVEVEVIQNSRGDKIDSAFVQSEEHRPNSKLYSTSNGEDGVDIPIIDLDKSSPQEVEQACKNWGFFHLINHGVPDHLVSRLESAAADFFSLPAEEKRKVSIDAQTSLGYFDAELTKNVRDWKEVFNFVPRGTIEIPTSTDPHDAVTETFTNKWPPHRPDLREACLAYAEAAREVCFKLLQLIAGSLGLPDERLNQYFEDDMSVVRLNCYPECPIPELALGVGRHKDPGALTLLYQDQVGGLQVRRKDNGQWLPVQPLPGSFVVNVGDCIQYQ